MAKGPAYHRFATLDRPRPSEYIKRVVDNSTKEIKTDKFICSKCNHILFYQPKECTNCFEKDCIILYNENKGKEKSK
ncbi:MAG: hypothetical protein J4473_05480 [Candidatus Aenigmarchaeota archaeon]|nr:hypothetical protein [Candidatus Aenigmarchaeota archaeon]